MRRHLILWAVILLAVALVVLLIRTARADEPVTMYCVSTDSYVNIREKPSTKARAGGRLDFGDSVSVSGSTTDSSGTVWYKVEGVTEQGYGYVCANYLILSEPQKCSLTATVNASGRVAVYRRVDGKRKTWAKAGSTLTVKIRSDSWCLTDKGWIKAAYLQFDE